MSEHEILWPLLMHIVASFVLSIIVGCSKKSKQHNIDSPTIDKPNAKPPPVEAPRPRSKLNRMLGRPRKKPKEEQSSSALTVVENPIATHLKDKAQPHVRGIKVKQTKPPPPLPPDKSVLKMDETQLSVTETSISRRSLIEPTQATPDDDDDLLTQEVSDYRTYASELSESEDDPAQRNALAQTPHDNSFRAAHDGPDSSARVSLLSGPADDQTPFAADAYFMKPPSATTKLPAGSLARRSVAGVPPSASQSGQSTTNKRPPKRTASQADESDSPPAPVSVLSVYTPVGQTADDYEYFVRPPSLENAPAAQVSAAPRALARHPTRQPPKQEQYPAKERALPGQTYNTDDKQYFVRPPAPDNPRAAEVSAGPGAFARYPARQSQKQEDNPAKERASPGQTYNTDDKQFFARPPSPDNPAAAQASEGPRALPRYPTRQPPKQEQNTTNKRAPPGQTYTANDDQYFVRPPSLDNPAAAQASEGPRALPRYPTRQPPKQEQNTTNKRAPPGQTNTAEDDQYFVRPK